MKQLLLLLAVFTFASIGTAQAQCSHAAKAAKTETAAKTADSKAAAVKVADVKKVEAKKACAGQKKACCASKAKATAASGKSCAGQAKKSCSGKATATAQAPNGKAEARTAAERSVNPEIRDSERAVPARAVKTSAGR